MTPRRLHCGPAAIAVTAISMRRDYGSADEADL